MGDTMNNPDFNVVIIGNKKPVHNNTRPVSINNIKKIENESIKLPTAPHDLKIELQQARLSKNMTQEVLNERLNLPKGTIRDYENGKAILNSQILSKINRVLGCHLKMPPKQEKLIE